MAPLVDRGGHVGEGQQRQVEVARGEAAAAEVAIESHLGTGAERGDPQLAAAQVGRSAHGAAVRERLARERPLIAPAPRGIPLVRYHEDADAARECIEIARGQRRAAGVDLGGAQRPEHLRRGAKRHELDVEPLLAEQPALLGHEKPVSLAEFITPSWRFACVGGAVAVAGGGWVGAALAAAGADAVTAAGGAVVGPGGGRGARHGDGAQRHGNPELTHRIGTSCASARCGAAATGRVSAGNTCITAHSPDD